MIKGLIEIEIIASKNGIYGITKSGVGTYIYLNYGEFAIIELIERMPPNTLYPQQNRPKKPHHNVS
jgi:hypothetical protein